MPLTLQDGNTRWAASQLRRGVGHSCGEVDWVQKNVAHDQEG